MALSEISEDQGSNPCAPTLSIMNSSKKALELVKIGGLSFIVQLVFGVLLGNIYLFLQGPHPGLNVAVMSVAMPLGGLVAVLLSDYGKQFQGGRFLGLILVAGVLPVPLMVYGVLKYFLTD